MSPPHAEGCSQPARAPGPFAAKVLAKHLSLFVPVLQHGSSSAGGVVASAVGSGFEMRLGSSTSTAMPMTSAWIGGIVRGGPSAEAFVVDDGTGRVKVSVPKSCQRTGEAALTEGCFALVIGALKPTKKGLQVKAQKVKVQDAGDAGQRLRLWTREVEWLHATVYPELARRRLAAATAPPAPPAAAAAAGAAQPHPQAPRSAASPVLAEPGAAPSGQLG